MHWKHPTVRLLVQPAMTANQAGDKERTHNEIVGLGDALDAAHDDLNAALEVLREIEWAGMSGAFPQSGGCCPVCHNHPMLHGGHDDDCKLNRILEDKDR